MSELESGGCGGTACASGGPHAECDASGALRGAKYFQEHALYCAHYTQYSK